MIEQNLKEDNELKEGNMRFYTIESVCSNTTHIFKNKIICGVKLRDFDIKHLMRIKHLETQELWVNAWMEKPTGSWATTQRGGYCQRCLKIFKNSEN